MTGLSFRPRRRLLPGTPKEDASSAPPVGRRAHPREERHPFDEFVRRAVASITPSTAEHFRRLDVPLLSLFR